MKNLYFLKFRIFIFLKRPNRPGLRRISDKSPTTPSVVVFNFHPSVQITRSILKVSFVDMINNIGSSLGLWLGASAFSIYKMIQTSPLFCCPRLSCKSLRGYLVVVASILATFCCASLGFTFIFVYTRD